VLNRHAIAAMTIGFYLGFVLASALLCHEILTNQTIFFRLNSLWQPEMRYVSAGGLPPYFLNHRMAALAMLFWPAALAGFSLPVTGWWRWALFAGLTPALVAVAASEHATSKAALIFGTCVVLAGLWSSRMTRRVLMVVWAIACVAVVPLCLAAYAGNLHRQAWLASSARHRVVIWKATSDLILEAPVLGAGIHSGRSIDRAEVGRKLAPGTEYFLSVSWHSHNAYLQVWFEAGAVGAAILLCLGLVTLRRIGGLEQVAQPFLLATFASCATISATGFSSFSPWLSASFALCAMFAALVRAQLRAGAQLAAATGQLSRSRAPV
jgi:O-antigen ligase